MDPKQRDEIQKGIDQGVAFENLSMHPHWADFWTWLEDAAGAYERKVHSQVTRADHIALVRALEGYDALANLIKNFDLAVRQLPELRQKLEVADERKQD